MRRTETECARRWGGRRENYGGVTLLGSREEGLARRQSGPEDVGIIMCVCDASVPFDCGWMTADGDPMSVLRLA